VVLLVANNCEITGLGMTRESRAIKIRKKLAKINKMGEIGSKAVSISIGLIIGVFYNNCGILPTFPG
jgi:hypothetical protein